MKKRNLVCVSVLLATSSTAFADVSHQFTLGLESDSSSEVTIDTINKINPALSGSEDVSGAVDESSSLFTLSYSYFLTPIKDDTTPYDLRQFYQHPSIVSVGLASFSAKSEDRTDPASTLKLDSSSGALMLGSEYYFPSDTGIMVGLGGGSGTITVDAGTFRAEADVDLSIFQFGVRQYAAKNVAFHLLMSNDETSGNLTGVVVGKMKETKRVTKLGTNVVFNDIVGVVFEVGRGERENESPFSLVAGKADTYDVAEVKTELTFYSGKQFSILLGVDLNGQFQTGMPSGNRHEITESKVRLTPRYWFSENLGLEAGLYSITSEELQEDPGSNITTTTKSSGVQINLGYRF